ncbi:transcription initiation factor TFIIB [Natronoarchaeum philippinense]|uniref:Transcription initiation factor IIB n=1 Tax=Natronoarchaeum philippinense TaxID=558529 RepID=A0A285P0S9_NATPI|nr:transcription initiation factor IIB family protein [Natronoarchaeum philippinense]SNZ15325.1 transcription initiation factor TFIIB [Natronoarchaeum philippinense]
MSLRDIYETGFDEDDGKSINQTCCIECGGSLQTEGGETACTECGLVLSDCRIDYGATPLSFEDEESNRKQTGAPITPARHDRGISSEIGRYRDANGTVLSSAKRRQVRRFRREHNRARWSSKKERNLATACLEIARLTSALELPHSVRERASTYYRSASSDDLIQGRSIEAMVAACVYAACRCGGYTRQIDEVAAVAHCDQQALTNCYGLLNKELGLKALVPTPKTLLPRLLAAFDIPETVQYRATELADVATEAGTANGCRPAGVAAACLYLASTEAECALRQTDIASVAGTSPVTLRKRYTELREETADR